MTLNPFWKELGLVAQGDDFAWAVTSPDDRFRYVLGRAWNPHEPFTARQIFESRGNAMCLGRTKGGDPRHPLMLVLLDAARAADPDPDEVRVINKPDDLRAAVERLLAAYERDSGRRVGCMLLLGEPQPALYFNGERFDEFAKLRSVR
ncbi:MAG TPA: hypothetical protein VGQ38_15580 [Gaiellaceae bacterium]|nr:hypothetical protein [Gaiellaceae bacterium]